jgi:hypothetical protein
MLSRPLSARDRRALSLLVDEHSALGVSDADRVRLAAMGALRSPAPHEYELTVRGRRLLSVLALVFSGLGVGCSEQAFTLDPMTAAPDTGEALDASPAAARDGGAGADTPDASPTPAPDGGHASPEDSPDGAGPDAPDASSTAASDGATDAAPGPDGSDVGPDAGADTGAPPPPPVDAGPSPAICCQVPALVGGPLACAAGTGFTCTSDANGCSETCAQTADGGSHCTTICGGLSACAPTAPACALGNRCVVATGDGQSFPGVVEACP